METMLRFLAIDRESQRDAAQIWSLIEPRTADIIENFYADVSQSSLGLSLSAKTIDHLKIKQAEHWKKLFESRFDREYFNNASLIGIKHYEIGLDVRWYIAGYMKIKNCFSMEIFKAQSPVSSKAQLVTTLDKYIAVDMALAISSYTSLLVD
jgi:Protoglobin